MTSLSNSDWLSCCIIHDGKRPLERNWVLHPKTPRELEAALKAGHGIGALTGPFSKNLVILDLDGFDTQMHEMADDILPPTGFMSGRGDCLKRHRGYWITDSDFSDELLPRKSTVPGMGITRNAMDDGTYPRFPGKKAYKGQRNGNKYAIEILAAGNQAVIPPSMHPSGQQRQWYGGIPGDPAKISYSDLIARVEKLHLALGGTLHKQAKIEERKPKSSLAKKDKKRSEFEMDELPDSANLENFQQAVLDAGPAIEGEGGRNHTFYVCALAGDYKISHVHAWPILVEWNKNNQGAWQEDELAEILAASNEYRNSAIGCRISSHFLAYENDSVKNAKVFFNTHYSENGLVNYDGDYYAYGDKKWTKLPSGFIENKVQREFESLEKISQRHINDVIRAIKNRSTVYEQRPLPFLLSDPEKNVRNTLIFQNGQLEIKLDNPPIFTFVKHEKDLFSLSHLPYNYYSDALCPQWLQFLKSIWGENSANILQLQEWFGYCLIHSYRWQKIMLLVGASRGGKGIIGNVLRCIIGHDDACGFQLGDLASTFGLQQMANKRVAVLGDAQDVERNKSGQVKGILLSISGDDGVSVNRKYKDIITKNIAARITMLANAMPTFIDNSDALSNRLIVLPFTRTFAGKEDTELQEKLALEFSGIFNWAIEGLKRLGLA